MHGRTMVLFLVGVLAMPLSVLAHTNKWETQADAAPQGTKTAVRLYKKALTTDIKNVKKKQGEARLPYLVAIERVYKKMPWYAVTAADLKKIAKEMAPLLESDFTTGNRQAFRRRVVTQYRMLKKKDEADILPGTPGFDIVKVPVILADIPSATFPVVKLPLLETPREWKATYDLAFTIVGWDGLYKPHRGSPMGRVYKVLKAKLDARGPEWRNDPELLVEWQDYWSGIKRAMDRKAVLNKIYQHGKRRRE